MYSELLNHVANQSFTNPCHLVSSKFYQAINPQVLAMMDPNLSPHSFADCKAHRQILAHLLLIVVNIV